MGDVKKSQGIAVTGSVMEKLRAAREMRGDEL